MNTIGWIVLAVVLAGLYFWYAMIVTRRNRVAEGKLPMCAEMCSTKALIAGDGDMVSDIYRERILKRGGRPQTWGWETAYSETS